MPDGEDMAKPAKDEVTFASTRFSGALVATHSTHSE